MERQYLINSLDTSLLTKVLTLITVAVSGPEVLSITLTIIHSTSFKIMEKICDKLKVIQLSDFPDENIDDCCTVQLALLQRMNDVTLPFPCHQF